MAPGRDRQPRGAPNNESTRGRGRGGARGARGDRGASRGGRGGIRARRDNDGDVAMGSTPDTGNRGRGGIAKSSRDPSRARGRGRGSFRGDTKRLEAAVEEHSRGVKSHLDIANGASGRPQKSGGKKDTVLVKLHRKDGAMKEEPSAENVIGFLEKKAGGKSKKVKLSDYKSTNGGLEIYVSPIHTHSLTRCDNFDYGDSFTLEIRLEKQGNELSESAKQLKALFKRVLDWRYNAEAKMLDLSCLRQDPAFQDLSEDIRESMFKGDKLFAAIFKQASEDADGNPLSGVQKRDKIANISLKANEFLGTRQIRDLSTVFPHLQGLDLSDNQISDVKAFEVWRRKLKALRLLYVYNNPFTSSPAYQNWQEELIKWFPALVSLNDVQVRSEAEAAANSSLQAVDYRVQGPYISDQTGMVAQFVRNLISGFDHDRHGLLEAYYDDASSFMLCDMIQDREAPDPYVKRSRNLKKVTTPTTRIDRMFTGQQAIFNVWDSLPQTHHPDLDQEAEEWCIESQLVPSVDGQAGPIGANGHIIYIHSKFMEYEAAQSSTYVRSFDRTVVIGPGNGIDGVRVISDTLVIRDPSDPRSWKPNQVAPPPIVPIQPEPVSLIPAPPEPAQPAVSAEQAQRNFLIQEFMKVTNLKADMAEMCLETVDYVPDAAMARYEEVKPSLGPDAYTTIV